MAGLLDNERESLSADLDRNVAAALFFAAALPELDLKRARPRERKLPLRPIVWIDPVTKAVFIRRRFVTHHDGVSYRVARLEDDGA